MQKYLLGIFLCTMFCYGDTPNPKKLPLPRFASLRSNNVNSHVGPGNQYPIEWKYQRQFLPIEIIAEFDTWRQFRDIDGCISWAHVSLLSGKRHVIVIGDIQELKSKPDEKSKTIATLEPSCIVTLKNIQGSWVYIESRSEQGKYQGWLKNKHIWGIHPYETKLK